MFTGLIEEIGQIKSIQPRGGGRRITVSANKIMDDLEIDDSVSINGACQTVVARTANTFEVEAVEETLQKTTLNNFSVGHFVNLERAVTLNTRMGGHLVQGHVDCTGVVSSVEKLTGSWLVWIEFPEKFSRYIVPVGSVCIDGISLTAARVEGKRFMVSIIPHTVSVTTLKDIRTGQRVNLEFDIIGKYVEKMMFAHLQQEKNSSEQKMSLEEMLRGF